MRLVTVLILFGVLLQVVVGQQPNFGPRCGGVDQVAVLTSISNVSDLVVETRFGVMPGENSPSLFIGMKSGMIGVISNYQSSSPAQMRILADFRSSVFPSTDPEDERGLLAFALHPQFQQNGRIFVWFSSRTPSVGSPLQCVNTTSGLNSNINFTDNYNHVNVLAEIIVSSGFSSVVPGRVFLEVAMPFLNNNGKLLSFDAEGNLLLGVGDGGCAELTLQNTQFIYGKIWVLNVDNLQTSCNKIVSSISDVSTFCPQAVYIQQELATGVQDPFGLSQTNINASSYYFSDLGKIISEINILPSNISNGTVFDYGWPTFEGYRCATLSGGGISNCFSSLQTFQFPLAIVQGTGITQPVIYTQSQPACLQNALIFGFFNLMNSNTTLGLGPLQPSQPDCGLLFLDPSGTVPILQSIPLSICSEPLILSSLAADNNGDIYLASFSTSSDTPSGNLWRVSVSSPVTP